MSLLISEAAHKGFPHFRWHDSGDLQSPTHLTNIILVAEATPHVVHWLPTRESLTVAHVSTHTPIPRNLIIRVSATHVDSPPPSFNLTSTVTSDPSLATCPAPSQGGKCASCRQCWDPTVRNVAYALH